MKAPLQFSIISIIASAIVNGFQHGMHINAFNFHSPTKLYSQDMSGVEVLLGERYPSFYSLISTNNQIWKEFRKVNGFTIFAPNEEAFESLGEKRQMQFRDERNLETVEKIGSFHCIAETVSSEELFTAGGVITMGGEIPIGRSTTGGFLGIGSKEDGGVLINGAKLIQTYEIGDGCIHEVDKLIAPQILWRYMDQLRIPGTN